MQSNLFNCKICATEKNLFEISYKWQKSIDWYSSRCKKLLKIKDFSNYRVTNYRWLTLDILTLFLQ